jgi:D-glycero-D-manno-heptose 1,7-bisphosphate phosphatase
MPGPAVPHATPSAAARAVFLDRDGVLSRCEVRDGKPYAPRRLADFRLLPRTAHAVGALKQAGFLVIVVTNQPDIGNGLVEAATVESMHRKLARALPVDDIFVCPHGQDAKCTCRKPRPGMLIEAARKWDIDLCRSYLIGDRRGDIVAGEAVGCYTVFIDRGYREPRPERTRSIAKSLPAAVKHILTTAYSMNPEHHR